MPKKIYIRTFGCQMNSRDSEFIAGLFLEKGYELADSPEEADVILFNTCSVRKHAEDRAISNMGMLLKRKAKTQNSKLYGIVGCTAQALKEDLFKRLPGLDLVCGTGQIHRLPQLIEDAVKSKTLACDNIDGEIPEPLSYYREKKKATYVSIMRGCNNFCSYCVVPYVRGKERSRKPKDILEEIEGLVQRGIRDIMLLGQNVNSYNGQMRDGRLQMADEECDFVGLLRKINNIERIRKIRFMTSHPKDASVRLFETMRNLDKVVKHLHLPLQSGSDRILELMERGYTGKEYLSLVKEARKIIPDLRLTTDIMVGFPTETEKDFNDTLNLMKKIKFDLAYIFKYSPRPGTKASGMQDDVPENVKKKRNNTLLELQKGMHKCKESLLLS